MGPRCKILPLLDHSAWNAFLKLVQSYKLRHSNPSSSQQRQYRIGLPFREARPELRRQLLYQRFNAVPSIILSYLLELVCQERGTINSVFIARFWHSKQNSAESKLPGPVMHHHNNPYRLSQSRSQSCAIQDAIVDPYCLLNPNDME